MGVCRSGRLQSVLRSRANAITISYSQTVFISLSTRRLFKRFIRSVLLSSAFCETNAGLQIRPFIEGGYRDYVHGFRHGPVLDRRLLRAVRLGGRSLTSLFFIRQDGRSSIVSAIRRL